MTNPQKTECFDYVVIGVKEYLEQVPKYPYPDLLRHGMNALSLEMNESVGFPKTMNGFLRLLEEPVKNWCPANFIPPEFDGDFGLMDEGSLSEEANDYLAEVLIAKGGLPESASSLVKQLAIDNAQFAKVLEKLREIDRQIESDSAQQEYVLFRRFAIENPYTTPSQIRRLFLKTKHISAEDVGGLYEECPETKSYWSCDRCGLLKEQNGKLKGIKPTLCGNHDRKHSHVNKVRWKTDLLRIKDGIHQRVCFPGIPELNLYSGLTALKEEHSQGLQEVKLYPGLDRYDLQLQFSDGEVWAIDIKDVRNPYQLAKTLKPLYREGSLGYDESFYVISDRCIENYPEYLTILRQEAKDLPKKTHLLSEKNFIIRAKQKITQVQKGRTV